MGSCSNVVDLALHARFTELHVALANYSESNTKFIQSNADKTPIPLKFRGHYFDGARYWTVDNGIEPFYLNTSFSLIAWIKCPSISTNMSVFSKNKVNPLAANEENLLNFQITTTNQIALGVNDGITPLYAIISSDEITNNWT